MKLKLTHWSFNDQMLKTINYINEFIDPIFYSNFPNVLHVNILICIFWIEIPIYNKRAFGLRVVKRGEWKFRPNRCGNGNLILLWWNCLTWGRLHFDASIASTRMIWIESALARWRAPMSRSEIKKIIRIKDKNDIMKHKWFVRKQLHVLYF